MAVFTVKDDGVGMSQEQLEKLMGTEEEPDHEQSGHILIWECMR